jgi:hypothetical protein
VTVCLSLLNSIHHLMILSSIAIAGGLYFLFLGFQLFARRRLLLATPTSRISDAALGLVEVNGMAAGPHTMPAPITGNTCFLYHTTAWQQRGGKNGAWEKVADETLHLPFFIEDSTGHLLIEPLGADLDLHLDFREEYRSSLLSLSLDLGDVSPRVSAFLSRHGIVSARRVRVEECSIKPADALFIAGTLAENPGVPVRPFSPRGAALGEGSDGEDRHPSMLGNFLEHSTAPQIIKLSGEATSSSAREMSQQAKIAAALSRAGITKPEAWTAAGLSYQTAAVHDNAPPPTVPDHDGDRPDNDRSDERHSKLSGFDLAPPVVLMKGANDAPFAISFRSQKEFVTALAWKSAALVSGGAAITSLGIYMLLVQMGLL